MSKQRVALTSPLAAGRTILKVILFLANVFPFPLKPLDWIVGRPSHRHWRTSSLAGSLVHDAWTPVWPYRGARPALVIAMGVRTAPHDRPVLRRFATTLARLGFVVVWPRLTALDRARPGAEHPDTFVTTVETLRQSRGVNPARISLVGFSVGGSTALVAAADQQIAADVRAVVFFGGFFDALDYLAAAAAATSEFERRRVAWRPSLGAYEHLLQVLSSLRVGGLLRAFPSRSLDEARATLAAAPPSERAALEALSPAEVIGAVRARLFILHDRQDRMVHYFESLKLLRALGPRPNAEVTLVDLFEHVQPRAGLTGSGLRELWRLARFLFRTLGYLDGSIRSGRR
ncbi:MAG: hypothetical protein U0556_04555 [Dehalococcoidia bacterium]